MKSLQSYDAFSMLWGESVVGLTVLLWSVMIDTVCLKLASQTGTPGLAAFSSVLLVVHAVLLISLTSKYGSFQSLVLFSSLLP